MKLTEEQKQKYYKHYKWVFKNFKEPVEDILKQDWFIEYDKSESLYPFRLFYGNHNDIDGLTGIGLREFFGINPNDLLKRKIYFIEIEYDSNSTPSPSDRYIFESKEKAEKWIEEYLSDLDEDEYEEVPDNEWLSNGLNWKRLRTININDDLLTLDEIEC